MNERPPPFSKSGISLKGSLELVCMKVNGEGVTLLKLHAVDDILCFMINRAVLYCTHFGELKYVNTNWYEIVLERTCQDICSARTTQ